MSITFYCLLNFIEGAIFHDGYEEAEQAFRYAVIRENMYNLKHELVPIIRKIDESDTCEAETVGELLEIRI